MGDKRYRVGGTRGGQDQFKWDDVKDDAHRENYLGHSLLAPVGRWQRGKDLKWWNNKKVGAAADEARAQAEMEKARLKQLDEDLLNEALGLAPRAVRTQQTDLSTAEKRQLLEKGGTADRDGMDTERVSGLGAGQANHHEHIPTLTLKERELERLKKEKERQQGGLTEASLVEIVDYEKEKQELEARAAANGSSGALRAGGAKADRKLLPEAKRAKKKEKKEKKLARKEKKQKKREKKRLKQAAKESERPHPPPSTSERERLSFTTSNDRANSRSDNDCHGGYNALGRYGREKEGKRQDSRRSTGMDHRGRDEPRNGDDGGRQRTRSPETENGGNHHGGVSGEDGGGRGWNGSRDSARNSGGQWSDRGRGRPRDSSRNRSVTRSRSRSLRRGRDAEQRAGRHRRSGDDGTRDSNRGPSRDGYRNQFFGGTSRAQAHETAAAIPRGNRNRGDGERRDMRDRGQETRGRARGRAARSLSTSSSGSSSGGSSSISSNRSSSKNSCRSRGDANDRQGQYEACDRGGDARKRSRSGFGGRRDYARIARSPGRRSAGAEAGRDTSPSFSRAGKEGRRR